MTKHLVQQLQFDAAAVVEGCWNVGRRSDGDTVTSLDTADEDVCQT